mgnify:CR=1 FL=1
MCLCHFSLDLPPYHDPEHALATKARKVLLELPKPAVYVFQRTQIIGNDFRSNRGGGLPLVQEQASHPLPTQSRVRIVRAEVEDGAPSLWIVQQYERA